MTKRRRLSERRYRWRTRLRRMVPGPIAVLVPKGRRDCGHHDWYNQDDRVDRCYHCVIAFDPTNTSARADGDFLPQSVSGPATYFHGENRRHRYILENKADKSSKAHMGQDHRGPSEGMM